MKEVEKVGVRLSLRAGKERKIMAIEYFKTGISSMGMDEVTSAYICDWPGCKREAEYSGYCEEHYEQQVAADR